MPRQTNVDVGSRGLVPGQVGFLIEEVDDRTGMFHGHVESKPLLDPVGNPVLIGNVVAHRLEAYGGNAYRLQAGGVVRVVRLYGEPHPSVPEDTLEQAGKALVDVLEGRELKKALEELGYPELVPGK